MVTFLGDGAAPMAERRSISVALPALLAEATLLEEDARFELIPLLLIRDILEMVRLKGLPINLAKGNIVFLVKILQTVITHKEQ
jgi:hypothetical protein